MSDPYRDAANALKAAGIDNANQEARWLIEYARESGHDLASFLKRRTSGEPLQHIIGTTPFHAITLKTDARALIPRSDSEILVDLALDLIPLESNWTIADLGAGTGALLLAVLNQRPLAKGSAIERSPEATSLLVENITSLEMGDRAKLFHGSWIDWTRWADCDLIMSNPPYIESAVIPSLASEVREHDPMEALDGGPDGLNAYREIIALGAAQMKSGAWLVLEIGYDQRESISALLQKHGFQNLIHRKDLGQNDRAIAVQKP
ncbi:MAG: peptide chain release factor N(5)-glutamine methyltransferase [Pseudomonadota bacterium]